MRTIETRLSEIQPSDRHVRCVIEIKNRTKQKRENLGFFVTGETSEV